MFIIECLPIVKGLNKESLSYFGAKYISPGSIIKVNLKNKEISALVIDSKDASLSKIDIKSANFQIKKINNLTSKPYLSKEFLDSVSETADYFSTTKGAILSHLLPKKILQNGNLNQTKVIGDKSIKIFPLILQTTEDERYMYYRSLIREEFAKNKSVYICFPKNENIKNAKEKLERGIETYVSVFHSNLNEKDFKNELKIFNNLKHPILILGTARSLYLEREDIGTIIIENENESGWKTLSRPFFDLRYFVESFACNKNIRCILGDTYLRTETLYKYNQGSLGEFENVKWRINSDVNTKIIDPKEFTKKENEFKILSKEFLNLLKDTQEKRSNIFIFAARKGLSAITICRDCGEQVKCSNCSSPIVLYKTNSGGVFKCHQCGETRDAAEYCKYCNSWKLRAYGVGIDKVANEIRENFPKLPIFEIHKDVSSTSYKAMTISKKFYNTRGAVLLGTEMALPYLNKKVTNAVIASFDSLFAIPDFRIKEKIFRMILQIMQLSKENFLIQTRNKNDPGVEYAISGNLLDFYKKEIEDRKILSYPPYSVFIKITIRGTKNFVNKEAEILKKIEGTLFPSMHEKRGEEAALNLVIKVPREEWPKQEILGIIKSLPPQFEVKIDPDNLL